jgi:hypothetical protein
MLKDLHLTKVLAAVLALWGSRRLWITIFAIGVMFAIFCHAERTLREIDVQKVTVYESMYQTMMWGVVTVAVGFTGFGTLAGFSRNVTSSATMVAQNIFNKAEIHTVEEKIERIIRPRDLDDGTIS